jgi:NTP pyrophosphatase (non-canonical NTP hydrolase)
MTTTTNPLLAVDVISEASHVVAFSDVRASKWELSLSDSTQSIVGALMHCPPHSSGWATDYLAHHKIHPAAPGMAPAAAWFELRVAPHDSPLIEIEKLRGRVLRYLEALPDNLCRKEIVGQLGALQDAVDAIHFALSLNADSPRWQSELATYEREQPVRKRKTFTTLVEAIAARQKEWDRDSELTPVFHALELGGDVGELLNALKKVERARLGLLGSIAPDEQLREELADVLICTYLLANALGVEVEKEARKKFNARSAELGFATRVEE